MKKFISVFLSVMIMLSVFPSAFAENEEIKIYYNRTYEGGNPFENITVANKTNSITCENENNGNKFILFSASDSVSDDCYLQYAFKEDVGDEVVFEISLRGADNLGDFNLRLSDAANNRIYLMQVDSAGTVSFEGGGAASLKKNKWTKFAFAVDFEKDTMQIYIDGKERGKKVKLDSTFDKPTRILPYMSAKSAPKSNVYIDDFKIYESSEPKEIEVSDADKVKIEPVYTMSEECGNAIYYNKSYTDDGTDPFGGVGVSAKKQKIEISEKDGNSFIKVDLQTEGDCFLTWNIPESKNRFLTLQADFLITKFGAKIRPLQPLCEVGSDGSLIYMPYSAQIGKVEENKWFNIAFCFDTQTGACDIYLNKERVMEGVSYSGNFSSFASYFADKSADNQSIYIDNFKMYEGKTIRDIDENEKAEKISVINQDNSEAESIVEKIGGNVVMLNVYSSAIYYDKTKKILDVGAYIKDNRTLVPVRAVSEAFGCDVDYDAQTQTITIDGAAKIVLGDKKMILPNGEEFVLDVGAELENNRTMLPLRALCENILSKQVTWDSRGLIIVSDNETALEEKDLKELNGFMLYGRPTEKELKDKISNKTHPRVVATKSDFDRIRQEYSSKNKYIKKWGDEVVSKANNALEAALPQYHTGGLLDLSADVADRLENFGMAYQLTGDKKYAIRAYETIKAVGEFVNWHPEHYLDVGEMSMGVAVGYDWCYDAFSKQQRTEIEEIIYKQCLSLYEASYYNQITYNSFIKNETNWNSWCNGPAIMCAAAVFDIYPDLCADLISKMLRSQELMLNEYYPDGAWMEGAGYWNLGLFPVALYCDTLKNTFGTDFNMSKAPGMDKSAYFSFAIQGPAGTNNFHDSEVFYQNCPVLFWCAKEYGDSNVTKMHIAQMEKYNQSGDAYSMIWYDKVSEGEFAPLSKDMYIKGGEFVAMRSSWENDNGAYVSYHGGVSDINHGQYDSGTYVIDMLGERFAIDLGKENYNAPGYFSTDRYNYYKSRPEGHNVYVINPKEGKIGQEKNTFSEVCEMNSSERGVYSSLDLTACYASDVNYAKRGFKLEDDRQSVVVADEIDLKGESEIYWFMHTDAEIEIADKNTVYLTKNGKKVKLEIACDAENYSVYTMDAMPLETSPKMTGEDDRSDIKKICVKINASGKVNIWAKMSPANLKNVTLETKKIDEWTNETGEIKDIPTVDMIYVNGKEISEFEKNGKSGYEMRYAYDEENVPQVDVKYDENLYKVSIKQADDFGDSANIVVQYKENSTLIGEYSVTFIKNEKLEDVEDMKRLQIVNAYASSTPEKQHDAFRAADNSCDAESRWAASGNGEWICMDLGDEKEVDGVGIAVMNATARKYAYEIEYSFDGVNWNTAVNKSETCGSEGIEVVKFNRVKARYVRYIGYGNTQNAWNSITEFAVLQNKEA